MLAYCGACLTRSNLICIQLHFCCRADHKERLETGPTAICVLAVRLVGKFVSNASTFFLYDQNAWNRVNRRNMCDLRHSFSLSSKLWGIRHWARTMHSRTRPRQANPYVQILLMTNINLKLLFIANLNDTGEHTTLVSRSPDTIISLLHMWTVNNIDSEYLGKRAGCPVSYTRNTVCTYLPKR